MRIIKRSSRSIDLEEAHGGSGARKIYADKSFLKSTHLEAITHGFLPAGKIFEWHDHKDIEEIMIVIKGSGEVHDQDGVYSYSEGDVFIFPANEQHKIVNCSLEQHEMIFVRVEI